MCFLVAHVVGGHPFPVTRVLPGQHSGVAIETVVSSSELSGTGHDNPTCGEHGVGPVTRGENIG